MNEKPKGSILDQAADRYLIRLRSETPAFYDAIIPKVGSGNAMGGMSGIWDDISGAISGVIQQAPDIWQTREQAKAEMERAEKAAEFELTQAQQQLQQQALQLQQQMAYAQAETDRQLLQEQLRQTEAERAKASTILGSLTGKGGANVILLGGLALALAVIALGNK